MKVYVVYGVLEERDSGMIVDHYIQTYDVFSDPQEAQKMVNWLKSRHKFGTFIAEEFDTTDTFNPDNYI